MLAAEKITELLKELRNGDPEVWHRLAPLVYDELRRLAAQQLRREKPDVLLQTTVVVNELFLRLVREPDRSLENRMHFYAVCAQMIRRILVDAARRRGAFRRGGEMRHVQVDEANARSANAIPSADWIALDGAVERLAAHHPRQAQVVELRYFLGLSVEETAELLNVTTKTVQRDWLAARGWLYEELRAV